MKAVNLLSWICASSHSVIAPVVGSAIASSNRPTTKDGKAFCVKHRIDTGFYCPIFQVGGGGAAYERHVVSPSIVFKERSFAWMHCNKSFLFHECTTRRTADGTEGSSIACVCPFLVGKHQTDGLTDRKVHDGSSWWWWSSRTVEGVYRKRIALFSCCFLSIADQPPLCLPSLHGSFLLLFLSCTL